MSSKFKQLFDIGNGEISTFFLRFACVCRRIFNKVFVGIFTSVVICVVVLPCSVKLVQAAAFESGSVSLVCSSMLIKGSFQQFVGINRVDSFVKGWVSDCRQFWGKSSPECVNSVIELFSPVSAYGEEVPSKKADNCCECRVSKCVDKELRHVFSSLVYAGVGVAATALVLSIYYRFIF